MGKGFGVKLLSILATFMLTFSSIGRPILADETVSTINVYFNSINIKVNSKPVLVDNILYEGTTYAPLRAVAEMLGKKVGWDGNTNTASIIDINEIVSNSVQNSSAGEQKHADIEVAFNKVNLTVSGKPVKVDNILYNGTTYAPMRAVAEMLGKKVGWDADTKTASIEDVKAAEADLSLPVQLRKNVKVGYNFNLELLQIAAAHSADFQHKGFVTYSVPINTSTINYFKSFLKKEYSADFYQQTMDGIINKYTHGETELVLSMDSGMNSQIFNKDGKYVFSQTGTIKNKDELLTALKSFKETTRFDSFIADNMKTYQDIEKQFLDKMNFDYIENIQNLLGLNMDNASFNIVLSPSMGGGTATLLKDDRGNPVYFNIMNPATEFSSSQHVLYHEEIHNFLRPILDKDKNKYSNFKFEKVLKKDVGSSNAFNETITRALTFILLETYHKVDITARLNSELDRGRVNTDKIYALIKNEYLGNRAKYSSIEDFIPVILDYLKSLEGDTNLSTPAGELKEAHITGVYWNGDSAIIEPYLSNFKTRNDVVFLATISDWIDGQDYRQLVNFFDNSDYRFFLKAEGKPNISAKVISPFGNGDEKMWGYAFYIAPDQLSKMESGIQYKLAPLNGKDGYKWIINNGVTITKP